MSDAATLCADRWDEYRWRDDPSADDGCANDDLNDHIHDDVDHDQHDNLDDEAMFALEVVGHRSTAARPRTRSGERRTAVS